MYIIYMYNAYVCMRWSISMNESKKRLSGSVAIDSEGVRFSNEED